MANEGIQDQVAGNERSTRVGILLGVSMQTQGNVYAKLLFDVAETWLDNWSIAVQAVTDDGLDLQPHHSECSLQRWFLREDCQRGKRYS